MDMNDYQNRAMRTAKNVDDEQKLVNGVLGLAGETGEVADYLKKVWFQGHDFDAETVKEEIGDVLWYIALICEALQCDMEDIAQMNLDKLWERYPDGFESDNSINR